MKMIDKTWAYTMLVDKPIIESLSAIAMHIKVDASRYIHMLSTKSVIDNSAIDISSPVIWSYFDTNDDMEAWQRTLRLVYGEVQTSHIQLRVLSVADVMAIPIDKK